MSIFLIKSDFSMQQILLLAFLINVISLLNSLYIKDEKSKQIIQDKFENSISENDNVWYCLHSKLILIWK